MTTSAIITTAGSASANAYVSLADANAYHGDRPPLSTFEELTTWDDASASERTAAILWATKLLDRLVPWTGQVVNDTQALLWPRSGMYYRNGYAIANDVIPADLQHATAEFAAQLLAEKRAEVGGDARRLGLTSFRSGSISLSFSDSSIPRTIPDPVYFLLPDGWIVRSAGVLELLRA